MSSPSTQLVVSKRMGLYEPFQQVSMWAAENFKVENSLNPSPSQMFMVNPTAEPKVTKKIGSLSLCICATFHLNSRFKVTY